MKRIARPGPSAERGIHTFSARYVAENGPIAALVGDADRVGAQTIKHGIAEASLALDSVRDRPGQRA